MSSKSLQGQTHENFYVTDFDQTRSKFAQGKLIQCCQQICQCSNRHKKKLYMAPFKTKSLTTVSEQKLSKSSDFDSINKESLPSLPSIASGW